MKFIHVAFKFPNTRKERDMVVYPKPSNRAADDNRIIVQGDDVIAEFYPDSGEGVYNIVKGHPGFHCLHPAMGAKRITFPMDFVNKCIENQPHKDDEVAPGLLIG